MRTRITITGPLGESYAVDTDLLNTKQRTFIHSYFLLLGPLNSVDFSLFDAIFTLDGFDYKLDDNLKSYRLRKK